MQNQKQPLSLKPAIAYIRASGSKGAKKAVAAQTSAINKTVCNMQLSVIDIIKAIGISGNSPTVTPQLSEAIAKAQKENAVLIASNFARFGRCLTSLLGFIESTAAAGVLWRVPNIIGTDGIELSSSSSYSQKVAAIQKVISDYEKRCNTATERAENTNLIATPETRQKGAAATAKKARERLPCSVKEHIAALSVTTNLTLQKIADNCNEIAKTDITFESYKPYCRMKISRILKVISNERKNGRMQI